MEDLSQRGKGTEGGRGGQSGTGLKDEGTWLRRQRGMTQMGVKGKGTQPGGKGGRDLSLGWCLRYLLFSEEGVGWDETRKGRCDA